MNIKRAAAALAGALVLAGPVPPALAEGNVQEVLVTAEMRVDTDTVPHVVFARRADTLVASLTVTCDTRDTAQRLAELTATVRNLLREASRDGRIEVALQVEDEGRVIPFTEAMIAPAIIAGSRPDTSNITFLLKTSITAQDSFDAATGRLTAFAGKVDRVGRSEVNLDDDYALTLVNPEQYRPQVLAAIAADARLTAAAFGPDYKVRVEGLQAPLAWYRQGDLDLALYLPYKLQIAP